MMTIAIITYIGIDASAQGSTDDARLERTTMDTRDRFQFGLKAGINYSNVYDTKGEKFVADPKFGIAMGFS